LLAAVMLFSGCVQATREIIPDDTLLLDKANNFFARSRFNQATDSYRKLNSDYPDSRHRKAAFLGLADSLYKEGQFEEANLQYERFVELYPLDEFTPQALFYFGMCHMMLTSTPDRSQAKTKMAIKVFDEFLARYPDNVLAPQAAWNKNQMESMMATSRLEVARFYFRTQQNGAVIDRAKEYIDTYPKGSDIPEAMYMLGESFKREQSYKKAAEVFTVLIGTYPQTEWAVKAKESASRLTIKAN